MHFIVVSIIFWHLIFLVSDYGSQYIEDFYDDLYTKLEEQYGYGEYTLFILLASWPENPGVGWTYMEQLKQIIQDSTNRFHVVFYILDAPQFYRYDYPYFYYIYDPDNAYPLAMIDNNSRNLLLNIF